MRKITLFLSLLFSCVGLTATAEVAEELVGKFITLGSPVTTITPGWYVLKNVGRNCYVSEETTAFKMRSVMNEIPTAEANAGFLFKITASTTDGKYNIQSGNGLYFELGYNSSSISTSARDFTIANISGESFYMQDVASTYVADGQENGNNFVGWSTTAPTTAGGNSTYQLVPVSLSDNLPADFSALQSYSTNVAFKLQQLYGLAQMASCYSSNRKQSNEGSYEALIDGSYSSYFHSSWSTASQDITDGVKHYLQVNLAEAVGGFRFYYRRRMQNNNDRPIDMTVQGSTDGEEYVDIVTITSGLPTDEGVMGYMSDVINGGNYTSLRFVVNKTSSTDSDPNYRCFFTFSEFYVLQSNESVSEMAEIVNLLNNTTSDETSLASIASRMKTIDEQVSEQVRLAQARSLAQTAISTALRYVGSEGDSHIGTGLNKYSGTTVEKLNELIEEAKSAVAGTDAEAMDNATDALNTELEKLSFNLPESGKFYRFKGKASEHYVDGTNTTASKVAMSEEGTKAGNIFYLDDNKLLGYATGYYLYSTYSLGNTSTPNTWNFKESEGENVVGYYNIVATNNTGGIGSYMYDLSNNIDRNSVYVANNCDWTIEEVTTLPVTVTAAGYATLYAPVALTIPSDVEVFTGTVDGNVLTLNPVTGTIPANIGVIVRAAEGTYHFDITTSEASAESALTGQPNTISAIEGVYTLQQPEGKSVGMYLYKGENLQLQGFKAYLPGDATQPVQGFAFNFGDVTGIGSVLGNESNDKAAIYDLGGRRVEKAQKGLYIVNGKKVIIK